MDLQTANLVPHGHLLSAWVRLMNPLAVDVNRDIQFWGIMAWEMDKFRLPVNLADAYNWIMPVNMRCTMRLDLTNSSARSSDPWLRWYSNKVRTQQFCPIGYLDSWVLRDLNVNVFGTFRAVSFQIHTYCHESFLGPNTLLKHQQQAVANPTMSSNTVHSISQPIVSPPHPWKKQEHKWLSSGIVTEARDQGDWRSWMNWWRSEEIITYMEPWTLIPMSCYSAAMDQETPSLLVVQGTLSEETSKAANGTWI